MVPVIFMDDLAEEIRKTLRHMTLPSPEGGTCTANVFQYGLPVEMTKGDRKGRFPYVLLMPQDGSRGGGTEPLKISVQMLIGLYDNGTENQGKRHVLNVINDISGRFQKDAVLKGRYYAEDEIRWVVDTEDEYPYHYGAVWMTFNIPAYRREDRYA